jgi:hypothetical protein
MLRTQVGDRPPRRRRSLVIKPATQRLLCGVLNGVLMPVWEYAQGRIITVVEHRNRIRTAGRIAPEELGIAHPDRVEYAPTPWFVLRRALPVKWVRPDDVFIDFGSGKGRAVFQAAAFYQFKRVIGVELSRELHEIAAGNIQRNRDRLRCQDVQLVRSDVLEYEIPDDVSVAFFFNPFTGQTFSTVVDRLLASVVRNPRTLRIVYVNPKEHGRLMTKGQIQLIKQIRRPIGDRARAAYIHVYEVRPRP